MISKWMGVAVIVAAAVGLVTYKKFGQPGQPVVAVASTETAHPAAAPQMVSVLLFADPGEAESSCGCGQIIRMFRAAAAKGAPVRQVDPQVERELTAQYGVTVGPTVVVLAPDGAVAARLVGEDADTMKAIGAALARVEPRN